MLFICLCCLCASFEAQPWFVCARPHFPQLSLRVRGSIPEFGERWVCIGVGAITTVKVLGMVNLSIFCATIASPEHSKDEGVRMTCRCWDEQPMRKLLGDVRSYLFAFDGNVACLLLHHALATCEDVCTREPPAKSRSGMRV